MPTSFLDNSLAKQVLQNAAPGSAESSDSPAEFAEEQVGTLRPRANVQAIEIEILDGLSAHRERLSAAGMNQAYLDKRNDEFIPQRPGESYMQFSERPKRVVCLVSKAIDALTANLYNPGPLRSLAVEDDSLNDPNITAPPTPAELFLQDVYASNQINSLMRAADQSATLNGACGIGIHATGDEMKPIRLDLYGADELAVWTPSDDPATAIAVCTIIKDKNGNHKFGLWTDDEYRTYESKKDQKPLRVSQEPNPYGRIPFVFAHNGKVLRDFWQGGVGSYLRGVNSEIDRELSDLAQQGQFAVPVGILRNAALNTRLVISPGYFNHLKSGDGKDKNATSGGMAPEASYLQPEYPAKQRMEAVLDYVYVALEMVGVPRSSIRMDSSRAISGIAILAEQLPLITYAKNRQPLFGEVEDELARAILACAGTYYERPELIEASTSKKPLQLLWVESTLPLPLAERDDAEQWELDQGLKSKVQICMARNAYTRPQAIAHLKQVEADAKLFAPLPSLDAARVGGGVTGSGSAGDGGDFEDDDEPTQSAGSGSAVDQIDLDDDEE